MSGAGGKTGQVASGQESQGGGPKADGSEVDGSEGDGSEGDGSKVFHRVAILKKTYWKTIGSPAKGRYAKDPAWLQQKIDEAISTNKGEDIDAS